MEYSIELFTIDDFPAYGKHTKEIVAEFNKILQDESSKKKPSGVHPLHHLKKDMLNNPDVYLSDTMLAKLYLENKDTSNTQHPSK